MDFLKAEDFIRSHFLTRDRENPDELVPLEPNEGQHQLTALCQKLQEQHRRVRIVIGKSRRRGVSRWIDALGACYMFAYPNFEARVMAHFDETAQDILSATALMVLGDGTDGVGIPQRQRHEYWEPDKEYKHVLIPHRTGRGTTQSRMLRASAKVRGKGRGLGFSFYHGSEVAYYPVDTPFTAVLPALAKSPERSAAFLESTGNGMVGEGEAFYKYWQQASDINKRGDSEWVRFFLSVVDDPQARSNQIPKDIPRDDEEKTMLAAKIPREFIAWRRIEIATTYQGIVEDFQQENPMTPEEMFVAGGFPAFAAEERDWALKHVCDPRLTAELIPSVNPNNPYDVRLSPMGVRGRIRIWELPQPHMEYYIGADLARGQDMKKENAPPGDYAAISVINGSTGEQAAAFSERLDPSKMADIINLLGRYYRTPEIGPGHCAMLNIEVNANLGAECQRRLRDVLSYPIQRFARWRGSRDDRIHRKPGAAIGWDTTMASRKIMFAAFRMSMRERQVVIHDSECAQQICAATMNDGRWEITRGHDDVLVANLLAWVARQQFPPRTIAPRREIDMDDHPLAAFDVMNTLPIVETLQRNEMKELGDLHLPMKEQVKKGQLLSGIMVRTNDPFAKWLGEPILG